MTATKEKRGCLHRLIHVLPEERFKILEALGLPVLERSHQYMTQEAEKWDLYKRQVIFLSSLCLHLHLSLCLLPLHKILLGEGWQVEDGGL